MLCISAVSACKRELNAVLCVVMVCLQHVQQVTEKQRRIREGEVYRLKTLKKEIRKDEALQAKKMEMRQKKSALRRKTFRLGRIR